MMNRKTLIGILALGALVVAGVFGAVAYNSAKAAAAAPEIASGAFFHMGVEDRDGVVDGYLAEALGITENELTATRQEARTAALEAAVAEGLITQTQADAITEGDSFMPFARSWSGWLSENGLDFEPFLADALGVSVEELQAAYTAAFDARINQAVEDGKLTEEQAELMKGGRALLNSETFKTSMQSAFEDAVYQAVESGVISQAQADLILEKADSWGLGGFDLGRFGGRGGHDRGFSPRGMFGGERPDASGDTTVDPDA
jgi:uncharacterized membrane protein